MDARRTDVRDADPLSGADRRSSAGSGRWQRRRSSRGRIVRRRGTIPAVRGIAYQILFVAVVAALVVFLVHNTLVNLRRQNIASGFGFLDREAAFGIGESLIAYSPADTYARAFLVGLINTLYVSALGIVLATDSRHCNGDRAAVEQLADSQARPGLRRDLPQHPAAAAAVFLVGDVAGQRAGAAPGLGAAAGRLRQQSRLRLSGSDCRPGASLDTAGACPRHRRCNRH